MKCFFVSDIHGKTDRYKTLFTIIKKEEPDAVFLGGDLLPHHRSEEKTKDFIYNFILDPMKDIKSTRFFLILGNDDPKIYEPVFKKAHEDDILEYVHKRTVKFDGLFVTGYPYVPPTPFRLKDWERYDVSRYTDVGGISPEDGFRTVPEERTRYKTIEKDLKKIAKETIPKKTIYLFHSPPYEILDMIDWRGQLFDHVPPDLHVGSIAIRRFIEEHHPFMTLHGHIHEVEARTGSWKTRSSDTYILSAAHGGPELALVRFDTDEPEKSTKDIIV